MNTIYAKTSAKPARSSARHVLPLGMLLWAFAYTAGCGDAVDVDESGTTSTGGGETSAGGGETSADGGETSAGGGGDMGWNPVTCQVDDDGSSSAPGGLEVRSLVLAPDSSQDANDGTTVYYPAILETDSTCKFSVIGWGNGTTGFGGAHYPAYFNHLASYGFVVVVAHTNQTIDESQPILTSVGLAMAEADDPQSVFFGKLEQAFGLMGKSQGAIAVGRDLADPDALAGVLIASGSSMEAALTKPGLFITGDSDFARLFVVNSYEAAMGPATFAQAAQEPNPQGEPDAGHQNLNEREGAIELSTSFMRCHLQSNDEACDYVVCENCQIEPWSVFETKGS